MNPKFKMSTLALLTALGLSGCGSTLLGNDTGSTSQTQQAAKGSSELDIQYEQFELENGLKVILHQDKSDPIVAMATIAHVGSNREKPGRTGFAHFFEHMAFNDSENVPKGANRKMIPELGGSRNGGTWSDGTIYYEVVPKDAFDKLLWIDSDRLGYMINTVDEATLEREKQVVKNEKRQRVDNRAYGHTGHVIKKALYPKSHPYNWTVIGDLADLQAATLDDVREFYDQYYIPSNVTLVVAGDIDLAETKKKVELWFGEIKSGPAIEPLAPQHVTLNETKKLYHEDNFAKLPQIRFTFPTVEQYTKDAYALDAFAAMLSESKNSPLYKTIVTKQKLAPKAYAWNSSEEITGTFTIAVSANPNIKLDEVEKAIEQSFLTFEQEGVNAKELTKYKAEKETQFYYSIESILDKALQIGIYNEYAGSPDFIKQDIKNITAVTAEDIMRVYHKYIKGQHKIVTSFVPKGQVALAASGSMKANVEEETIKQGAEKQFVEKDKVAFKKTATKHDRSEPPLSDLPALSVPEVYQQKLNNGIRILGIEQNELPVVNFNIRIDGGQLLDESGKAGTAYLTAQLLNEGTQNKSPQELAQAIGLLGASISVSAERESIYVEGRTLAKNFEKTLLLVTEMLMEPRFDEAEFDRLKATRLTSIKQSKGNAPSIAANAFYKALYGDKHAASLPMGGTEQSVKDISLTDVKDYYASKVSPKNMTIHVVGDVKQHRVAKASQRLSSWQGEAIALPQQPNVPALSSPQVYFIDLPGAKQSVIMAGKPTVPASDDAFHHIVVANNLLGGSIGGRLAQTLRIQKGYTYGAYSYLRGTSYQSPFVASSQVRTNVTLESLEIFKDLIGNYKPTFTEDDLAVNQNMIIKSNARKFETLDQQLGMLNKMSRFDLASDYIEQEQAYVMNASVEDIHRTIVTHMDEQQMVYVIVGDAKSQLSRIKDLGYGEPVILDVDGNKI